MMPITSLTAGPAKPDRRRVGIYTVLKGAKPADLPVV
jgi:hypothetical protein